MATPAKRHRLILQDRGLGHRHRWHPTCICGWVGVFRRRKCDAKSVYRQHVNGAEHSGFSRAPSVRARRLTPRADLPDVLR